MGVQPIDLQNMYSQLSNVAKSVAGQQQTAQLSDSMQQQNLVQKNMENAAKIQQTNEKSNTGNINENGHKGSSYSSNDKKKQNKNNQEQEDIPITKKYPPKPEYIGTIIDITR